MLDFETDETMAGHYTRIIFNKSRDVISNDSRDSDCDLDLLSFEYDDAVDSTGTKIDFLGHENLINLSSKLKSNPESQRLLSDQSFNSKCEEKLNVSEGNILTGVVNRSQDSDNDVKFIEKDQIALESTYRDTCSASTDKKSLFQKSSVKKFNLPNVLLNEETNVMIPKHGLISLSSELSSCELPTFEKKIQDGNILSNKSVKKSVQVGFVTKKTKAADLQYEEESYTCTDSAEGYTYRCKPGESMLNTLRTSKDSNLLSDDTNFKLLPGDFLFPYMDHNDDIALVSSESKQRTNQNVTGEERKVSNCVSVESRILQSLTQETKDSLLPYEDSDNDIQSTSSASKQRQILIPKHVKVSKNFSNEGFSPRTIPQVKEDSLPPYVDSDEAPSSSLKLNQVKFLSTEEQQDTIAFERGQKSRYKINSRKRKYPEIGMADSTLVIPVPPKHSKREADSEGQRGFSEKDAKLPGTRKSFLPVPGYQTQLTYTVANKTEVDSCLVSDTLKHSPVSQTDSLVSTLTEDDIIHKVQEIFPNVSWFYLVKLVKNMCEKNPDRNTILLEIVDSFSTSPYPTNPDFNLYQPSSISIGHSFTHDGEQESNEMVKGKKLLRKFSQKSKSSTSGCVTSSIEPVPSSSTSEVSSSVSDSDIKSQHGVSSSEVMKMRCENCNLFELSTKISECCDEHPLCVTCVEKAAKEAISGKYMGPVMCPKPGCQSSVPKSQLQNVLPVIIMDLLEDKWLKEAHVAVEHMEGLVKCPRCTFKAFMDSDAKMFHCLDCSKITCRYCQKDWVDNDHNECTADQTSSMTTEMETATSGDTFAFPPNWDMTSHVNKSSIYVALKSDAPEYIHVMTEFQRSGGINYTIRNIYRIQNPRLWQKYSLQKSHMLEDLGLSLLNEKHLYHGTNQDAVEKICKEGFDWRLCGIHGTAYGKGTYFALDVAISSQYSSNRQNPGLFVLTNNQVGTFGNTNGNSGNFGALQASFGNNAPSLSGFGFFGAAVSPNSPESFTNTGSTFGRPLQSSCSAFGGAASSGNSNTGFTFVNSNISSGFGFACNSGNSLIGIPSLSSTSNLSLPPPAFSFPVSTSPNQNKSSGTNTTNLFQPISYNPCFGQNCLPSQSGASFLQPSQFMFYAKVLLGQCCRGDPSMKKPPINQNDPQQRPYNSVVDHTDNPRIFVIFDSSQTYPEYLIEFI